MKLFTRKPQTPKEPKPRPTILRTLIDLFSLASMLALAALLWFTKPIPALFEPTITPTATTTPTETPTVTPSPTLTPTPTLTFTPTLTPTPTPLPADAVATYLLALEDNGYTHLFVYAPSALNPMRLTNGPWNDSAPSFSPDGKKVAFASDRNNYWDIYILDLSTATVSRVTDTAAYDTNPTWSPDGNFIVYESYVDDNLEIFINAVNNPEQAPIRLTNDPGVDQHPVWSPGGRQIAFSSNRTGDFEIWLANLNEPGEGRFVNASQSEFSDETHPAWSPDSTRLLWASTGHHEAAGIYLWNSSQPETAAHRIGSGNWPFWSDQNDIISARLGGANSNSIFGYNPQGIITVPAVALPTIHGMDWQTVRLAALPATFQDVARLNPTPLWQSSIEILTNIPSSRNGLVEMENIKAPHPYLHDAVDEAFDALRQRAIDELGWDVMESLQSAYTPLTSTLDPGRVNDWLYTGRAFAINPVLLNAGWMLVIREEYNDQTYWRIYLRTLAQDGSMGEPLRDYPWDLNARYSLNPQYYEQGGASLTSIPTGYWIDFTDLASKYSWQRIPAQTNWHTYFNGAQFNQFAIPGGLTWREAMLQLYPPDMLVTATIAPTRTPTFTPTPRGYRYLSPTPTLTPTSTSRPTFTPAP